MDDSGLQRIPLTRIVPSRWQPRETAFDAERLWELACSIKENRLINPVVVFPVKIADDDPEPWYELVAGERRCRAMLGLAWASVHTDMSEKQAVEALAAGGIAALPDDVRKRLNPEMDQDMILARIERGKTKKDLQRLHRLAVVENIERESLSPIEEARALEGLADEFGWSQRVLARHIGRSQSYVAQRLSLLGLTEEAQEAVSTRVLNTTHARAIASVPEELQPVVTEHVVAAVQRDDSPATTRQVQNLARQVAAFVDPARWEPPDEILEPCIRNRLLLVKWAVEQVDLEKRGEYVFGLREAKPQWQVENLLGKKPQTIVRANYQLQSVLKALRGSGAIDQMWETFAAETRRTCEVCLFGAWCRDKTLAESAWALHGHCEGWREKQISTCENFIGPADPVIIPVGYYGLRGLLLELGLEIETEPFDHVRSVEDYVKAYGQAAALKHEQEQKKQQEEARAHATAIQRFFEWQLEQPDAVLAHFQAHTCSKCANYRAELVDQDLPPCRWAAEPLGCSYDDEAFTSPEFAVLVAEVGWMYPRCSEFRYAEPPELYAGRGESFGKKGNRGRVVEWLHGLCTTGQGYHTAGLWGVLQWLDYGRAPRTSSDWDKLKRFVKREWDALGSDGAVAMLLDVALSEARARGSSDKRRLVNAVTGEVEEFAVADYRYVAKGKQPPSYSWRDGRTVTWVLIDGGEANSTSSEGD